jgi:hypothetical protein
MLQSTCEYAEYVLIKMLMKRQIDGWITALHIHAIASSTTYIVEHNTPKNEYRIFPYIGRPRV